MCFMDISWYGSGIVKYVQTYKDCKAKHLDTLNPKTRDTGAVLHRSLQDTSINVDFNDRLVEAHVRTAVVANAVIGWTLAVIDSPESSVPDLPSRPQRPQRSS
jgi:hypothetical protein